MPDESREPVRPANCAKQRILVVVDDNQDGADSLAALLDIEGLEAEAVPRYSRRGSERLRAS